MACLCEKIAGKDIDLSPTCIGNLWIFQNIEPAELEALSREALRKKSAPGQTLFMQGDPTDEMFLMPTGRSLMSIQPLESIGIDWEISLIRFPICGVLSNWNTPGFAA